jgi:hypothetical protein
MNAITTAPNPQTWDNTPLMRRSRGSRSNPIPTQIKATACVQCHAARKTFCNRRHLVAEQNKIQPQIAPEHVLGNRHYRYRHHDAGEHPRRDQRPSRGRSASFKNQREAGEHEAQRGARHHLRSFAHAAELGNLESPAGKNHRADEQHNSSRNSREVFEVSYEWVTIVGRDFQRCHAELPHQPFLALRSVICPA